MGPPWGPTAGGGSRGFWSTKKPMDNRHMLRLAVGVSFLGAFFVLMAGWVLSAVLPPEGLVTPWTLRGVSIPLLLGAVWFAFWAVRATALWHIQTAIADGEKAQRLQALWELDAFLDQAEPAEIEVAENLLATLRSDPDFEVRERSAEVLFNWKRRRGGQVR